MTCIVGLEVGGGRALLAADTCISDAQLRDQVSTKIFSRGDFAFACAGYWRTPMIMRQTMRGVKKFTAKADPERWILTQFVPWYGGALQRMKAENEAIEGENIAHKHSAESVAMVAVGGEIWVTESGLDPVRSCHGLGAIGSGRMVALGSLHATPQLKPLERATRALEIASKLCHGVAPPYTHAFVG